MRNIECSIQNNNLSFKVENSAVVVRAENTNREILCRGQANGGGRQDAESQTGDKVI